MDKQINMNFNTIPLSQSALFFPNTVQQKKTNSPFDKQNNRILNALRHFNI